MWAGNNKAGEVGMDNLVVLNDSSIFYRIYLPYLLRSDITLMMTILLVFSEALMIFSGAYDCKRPYVPLHFLPYRGSQFRIMLLVIVSIDRDIKPILSLPLIA